MTIWAPSGDNSQPWHFALNAHPNQIVIHVNESRDLSPMNAGQRMSRIAVGAAAENVRRTCDYNRIDAQLVCESHSCCIMMQADIGSGRIIEPDPVILSVRRTGNLLIAEFPHPKLFRLSNKTYRCPGKFPRIGSQGRESKGTWTTYLSRGCSLFWKPHPSRGLLKKCTV